MLVNLEERNRIVSMVGEYLADVLRSLDCNDGEIEEIEGIVSDVLKETLDRQDIKYYDVLWLNILELLKRCDGNFYGDFVIPIRGNAIKSFQLNNVTSAVVEAHSEILKKLKKS